MKTSAFDLGRRR